MAALFLGAEPEVSFLYILKITVARRDRESSPVDSYLFFGEIGARPFPHVLFIVMF